MYLNHIYEFRENCVLVYNFDFQELEKIDTTKKITDFQQINSILYLRYEDGCIERLMK